MRTIQIVNFLFCIFAIAKSNQESSTIEQQNGNEDLIDASFRIAGYIPDYRFGIDLNKSVIYLDDLYMFSLSPKASLGPSMLNACCLNTENYVKARQARAHKKQHNDGDLKLWVSLGGGGRSDDFLKVKKEELLTAVIDLVKKEGLDGVDFDCEAFKSMEEYKAYEKLLIFAAKKLHKESIMMSVAIHKGQKFQKKVYTEVDRVNLMTYDMSNKGYHASLKLGIQAIDELIESGCPVEKIFLGIPAYGRSRDNFNDVKTYGELIDEALKEGLIGREDDLSEDLSSTFTKDNYVFESQKAVAGKVRYSRREGLGGAFFWEIGQDKHDHESAPGGLLLRSAAEAKVEKIPKQNKSGSRKTKDEL